MFSLWGFYSKDYYIFPSEQQMSHQSNYSITMRDAPVQQWTLLAVNDVVFVTNAECN